MVHEVCTTLRCPVGTLLLKFRDGCLAGIELRASAVPVSCAAPMTADLDDHEDTVLVQARRQLDEYFSGRRTTFELPLDLSGCTPFTRRVLETLQGVGYGETLTYGELAARVGSPRGARAIGRAMAVNPLPIVIPCHRVVAAGGKSGGYSGGAGLPTKEWLLAHERTGRFASRPDSQENTA